MNDQMIFQRREIKYRLTRQQKNDLLQGIAGLLALDPFGRHTIRNIYFDTDTFRLVRKSIEKPVYKEKLRVRAYEKAEADSPVFVELKKKYESVVYKRRLVLPHRPAMDALEAGRPLPDDSQIGREIEAFRAFYGSTLRPAMMLTYEREAYYPVDGSDFRLTLDENILWRTGHMDLGGSVWGRRLMEPDEALLELKVSDAIPLWMARLLSEHGIYQTSFSKYGAAYRQMLMREPGMGGLQYA